jgi:hypothetical protein
MRVRRLRARGPLGAVGDVGSGQRVDQGVAPEDGDAATEPERSGPRAD